MDDKRAFRRLLRDRSPLGGTFLDLGSACSAEIAARAGFDFVVVDLEHGNGDVADARMQIHAAAAFCGVFVRVAGASDPRIGSVLDYGADGIVVPRIRTADEASVAASAARFGVARGLSPFCRAAGYGRDVAGFTARSDEAVGVIVQIETAEALERVDEIAALAEVDALLLGPTDLALSLHVPADLDHPALREASESVARAASTHGKSAAIFLGDPLAAPGFRSLGFNVVIAGFETKLLADRTSEIAALVASTPGSPG